MIGDKIKENLDHCTPPKKKKKISERDKLDTRSLHDHRNKV